MINREGWVLIVIRLCMTQLLISTDWHLILWRLMPMSDWDYRLSDSDVGCGWRRAMRTNQ